MKGVLKDFFKVYSTKEFEDKPLNKNAMVIFLPKKATLDQHPFWVVDVNFMPQIEGFVVYPIAKTDITDLFLLAFQLSALPGLISLLLIKKSGNYRKSLIKREIQNFTFHEYDTKYTDSITRLQSLIQTAESFPVLKKGNTTFHEENAFEIHFLSEIRNAIEIEYHLPAEIKEKTKVLEHWNEHVKLCSDCHKLKADEFIKILDIDNPVLSSVKRLHVIIRDVVKLSLNSNTNVENQQNRDREL